MKKSTLFFAISFVLLLLAIFLAFRYTRMVNQAGATGAVAPTESGAYRISLVT